MSWKTDRRATIENRGMETIVTLKVQRDTGLFRVRRVQRVIGAQQECTFDTIVSELDATEMYKQLCAQAITEEFSLKDGVSAVVDLTHAEEEWPVYGESVV